MALMLQDASSIWIEAENAARQMGSTGPDRKAAACGLRVLGSGWGGRSDHWAEYALNLKTDLQATLFLRYARAMSGDAALDVLLDGNRIGMLKLASTGGWGDRNEDWKFAEMKLGNLKAGAHTIRLVSLADRNNVNLDGFFISNALPASFDKHWVSTLPEKLREAARIRPEERRLSLRTTAVRVNDKPIELPERLRRFAAKPSPYLVKAYDAGAPTDFDRDVVWHSLQKEKDARFFLAQAGKLGVVDFVSNISVTVDVPGKAEITHHLIDGLFERVIDGDIEIRVALIPVFSDTLLVVLDLKNNGEARTIPVSIQALRPAVDLLPRQDYSGATTTTGKLRWFGEGNGAAAMCLTDWNPEAGELLGSMICTLASSETPYKIHKSMNASIELTNSIPLGQGVSKRIAFAANLRRFGPSKIVGTGGMQLYAAESDEEAVQRSYDRAVAALGSDWPKQIEESARRYASFPTLRLPERSWELDFMNCLELPLASTYTPCREMMGPFYTFCRAQAVEPFGWWSYGMHAHESLSTFVVNSHRPELSQQWLLSHFAFIADDGEIPYGVSPKGIRKQEAWNAATAPFMAWEAWVAYTYSGNKKFLELAFDAAKRNHDWWLSKRTRTDVALQRWLNFMETVRDDQDLDTWTFTNGAENQEALDLNCYLLIQERALERMARELGKPSQAFGGLAQRRAELMQKFMWNKADGLFYGFDVKTHRQVTVKDVSTFLPLWAGLATSEQAESIVKQLFDTRFPVATLDPREKGFSAQGHWHGSNWVEMSHLVLQGLRQYGYYEKAAKLAEINCRMVFQTLEKTAHFREYYNTMTGDPAGLTDYIWSAMPAAMIVEILFGIRPTSEGVSILPALPPGWDEMAIDNVSVRGKKLTVSVRRAKTTSVKFNGHAAEIAENRGLFVPWKDLDDTNSVYIELAAPPDKASAPPRPRITE
jgi:hypothetical protein